MSGQNGSDHEMENLLEPEKRENENQVYTSLRPYKIGFVLVSAARGTLISFVPLYLKRLGLSPANIGIVMFFRCVGGFAGGAMTPYLKSVIKSQASLLYYFSGGLLLSSFVIEFLTAPHLEIFCRISDNHSVFNVSTEFIGFKPSTDFSWMYVEEVHFLVFLGSLVMFLSEFSGGGIDTLQHSITMVVLRKRCQDYGFLRAWGALGRTLASVPTGTLLWYTQIQVKICSEFFNIVDYHLISYVFMGYSFALLLNVNNIKDGDGAIEEEDDCDSSQEIDSSGSQEDGCTCKEDDDSSNKVMCSKDKRTTSFKGEKLISLVCNKKVLPWLFVLLSRSMFSSVTQGFLNWYMESLGADPFLIGVTNGVTTTAEFFVFFLTPYLIQMFGYTCLVSVGIVSYIIRLLFLSFVIQPCWIIPLELFEGVMFAILWSSLVSYLSTQVPQERQSEMQGIIHTVKVLGYSIGFLLSGYLTQMFGSRIMFRIFASCAAFVSVVFILTQIVALCLCHTKPTNSDATRLDK